MTAPRHSPESESVTSGRKDGVVVLRRAQHQCGPIRLQFSDDDISGRAVWRISEVQHAFVVHLGGRMDELETELDGHGGSRGPALPGEIWSIPAKRNYASQATGGTIRYGVLFLDPTALDALTGGNGGWRDVLPVAGVHDEFLHQSVRRLDRLTQEAGDIGRIEAERLGQALCCYLFQAYRPAPNATVRPAQTKVAVLEERTVRALRNHIHDNLGGTLTLSTLAGVAGLSVHHLLVAFRQAFGRTPAQYIIGERLRFARRLLVATRHDITTIALETGFSSHSHLTGAFVRHFGKTPSQFRRESAWRSG